MKTEIVLIHGGDTFENYEEYLQFLKGYELNFERTKQKGWKSSLGEKLGESYELIAPSMPCKNNAKYLEWKIWFEKYLPFLAPELILVGHSLGGIFLAKYLAENQFPKKINALFLISAPYEAGDFGDSLADFILPNDLSLIGKQAKRIFLYHSQDDKVVDFADLSKYQKALPKAESRIFTDRGHFNQEEFPELVAALRSL